MHVYAKLVLFLLYLSISSFICVVVKCVGELLPILLYFCASQESPGMFSITLDYMHMCSILINFHAHVYTLVCKAIGLK